MGLRFPIRCFRGTWQFLSQEYGWRICTSEQHAAFMARAGYVVEVESSEEAGVTAAQKTERLELAQRASVYHNGTLSRRLRHIAK